MTKQELSDLLGLEYVGPEYSYPWRQSRQVLPGCYHMFDDKDLELAAAMLQDPEGYPLIVATAPKHTWEDDSGGYEGNQEYLAGIAARKLLQKEAPWEAIADKTTTSGH